MAASLRVTARASVLVRGGARLRLPRARVLAPALCTAQGIYVRPSQCSLRSLAMRAADKPEPSTAKQRNVALARRMKDMAPDEGTYRAVRQAAAALMRGSLPAEGLFDVFTSVYGDSQSSMDLFLELADLVPDATTRSELLALTGLVVAETDTESSSGGAPQADHDTDAQKRGDGPSSALLGGASDPQVGAGQAAAALRADAPGAEQLPDVAAPPSPSGEQGSAAPNTPDAARPPRRAAGGAAPAADPVDTEAALRQLGFTDDDLGVHHGRGGHSGRKKRRTGDAGAGGGAGHPGGAVLYWTRQDFRLHDNPALHSAAKAARKHGTRVYVAFVHSPEEDGDDVWTGQQWRPGEASLLWQHHALEHFDARLQAAHGPGARIIFLRGPYADALQHLCAQLGIGSVFANRRHEPAMRAADAATAEALQGSNVQVHWSNALLLHAPEDVAIDMSRWRGHFGTLMPFYAACERAGGFTGKAQRLAPPPDALPGAEAAVPEVAGERVGVDLNKLRLYAPPQRKDGSIVDWGAPIRAAWDMTEAAALAQLERFVAVGLKEYEAKRSVATGAAVSRLSPYLHFGQLSPRHMMRALDSAGCRELSKTFWRRLVWRDLAYWQLHHWPRMPTVSMRAAYEDVQWTADPAALHAWQRGRTGFPLVDAGMRELWGTGYMHQNVRIVVACFLTEYLNQHWAHGARWFHDALVDGDLAINCMMWQNAGKSGLDQWNFTSTPAGASSDRNGEYVRRWVPELKKLPSKYIHAPWSAPAATLAAAGVRLGETYPERITTEDLGVLRQRNVAALRAARAKHPDLIDAGSYDVVPVPPGSAKGVRGDVVRVHTVPGLRGNGKAGAAASGGRSKAKAKAGAHRRPAAQRRKQ